MPIHGVLGVYLHVEGARSQSAVLIADHGATARNAVRTTANTETAQQGSQTALPSQISHFSLGQGLEIINFFLCLPFFSSFNAPSRPNGCARSLSLPNSLPPAQRMTQTCARLTKQTLAGLVGLHCRVPKTKSQLKSSRCSLPAQPGAEQRAPVGLSLKEEKKKWISTKPLNP
jgi:hypothetical protein